MTLTIAIIILVILHIEYGKTQAPFDPITSHLLDTATGIPGANVSVKLFRKAEGNNWDFIAEQLTASNGRIANIIAAENFTVGNYKLWFDTEELYNRTGTPTFYPFIEVRFRVTNASEHYHIPILASPFGYSSYKGYFSSSTPPPPAPDPLWGFILDTTSGTPAANVTGKLYRYEDDDWTLIITKNTGNDGIIRELFENSCDFIPGTYKFSFNVREYWNNKGYHRTIFPNLEVTFKVGAISVERLTVPILMSPYLFTTYKGNSAPNPVACSELE